MGYGVKSRSSDLGSGDPAKDAGLPSAPPTCCPSSRCQPDLDSCVFTPRATWPTLSAPQTFASLGHLLLATSLHSACAPASFPPPAQGEVAPLRPPASGLGRLPSSPREEHNVSLTHDPEKDSEIKNGSYLQSQAQGRCFHALSCFPPSHKPRRQVPADFHLAGEEKGLKGKVTLRGHMTKKRQKRDLNSCLLASEPRHFHLPLKSTPFQGRSFGNFDE